jgi:hypothetical protein
MSISIARRFLGPVLAALLIPLVGCLPATKDRQGPSAFRDCTQIASLHTILVQVQSDSDFPANTSFSLEGSGIEADECGPADEFSTAVRIDSTRRSAVIQFTLDSDSQAMQRYFPDGVGSSPSSDLISLRRFSRPVCGDQPTDHGVVQVTPVSWRPVFANGPECGVTSHVGTAGVAP